VRDRPHRGSGRGERGREQHRRLHHQSESGRVLAIEEVPDRTVEDVAPRRVRFAYDERGRLATVAEMGLARVP
jgi:hypothetical protein